MVSSLSRQLADGSMLIVDDRVAAIQLETFLALKRSSPQRWAWPTPSIQTHAAWAAEVWSAQKAPERLLLGAAQSDALWRKVISASEDDGALLHLGQVAAWAAQAWTLLLNWRVDFQTLQAREDDSGFSCFLNWAHRFSQQLGEHGWLERAELNDELRQLSEKGKLNVPPLLLWTDLRYRTPALDSLISGLESAGCQSEFWEPAVKLRSATQLGLANAREELSTAILWAQNKLSDNPRSRIALVIASDPERDLLLARCRNPAWGLSSTGGPKDLAVVLDGQPCDREPTLAAALDCLELFGRNADFRTFSRFLRSPFLGEILEDTASRSSIEAQLREEPLAQLGFMAAYASAGLRAWLTERAPRTAAVITALIQQLGSLPPYQTPTQWARLAQEILSAVGWPGTTSQVPSKALETWNRILTDLTLLTPVVGAINFESALASIEAALAQSRYPAAPPLAGIAVLSRPEDVGPGYDAAWITGMTDRAWPRPPQPNPLLPLSLQAACQMPFATPAEALRQCQQITARLAARVPEIIFSYPLVENDFATAPSPLLRNIVAHAEDRLPRASPGYYRPDSHERIERVEDPVPPLAGDVIPGGVSTLAMQARCPLGAFVDSRLFARPLEPLVRGVSPRQRGILTHRVLELLFTGCAGRRELAGYSSAEIDKRVAASVSRALRERFRGAGHALRGYLNLERDRLGSLARGLIAADLARGEFTIEGLELKHVAEIAGWQIGCRIDRIDMLSDHRLAVIDYKTGRQASPADWLKPRLLEPQLPLYLQVVATDVAAIVYGVLKPGRVEYKGLSDINEAFPGRMGRLPAGVDWASQQAHWAAQLIDLVTEFSRGDGRIFVAGSAVAAGPLAPLTRVYEQLAAFRDGLAVER